MQLSVCFSGQARQGVRTRNVVSRRVAIQPFPSHSASVRRMRITKGLTYKRYVENVVGRVSYPLTQKFLLRSALTKGSDASSSRSRSRLTGYRHLLPHAVLYQRKACHCLEFDTLPASSHIPRARECTVWLNGISFIDGTVR